MIPRIKFSIKVELEFFAAARVKRECRKEQNRSADVDHVQHNLSNQQRSRDERNHAATFLLWGELEAADFADQRIALPIAYEISCRAWP